MRSSAPFVCEHAGCGKTLPWSRASAGMVLCENLTRRKSKWGCLVRSGAWPFNSVGTSLLREHRAWLRLCPEMGSRWAAWKAMCFPRRHADCSCTPNCAVWRTTDQPARFSLPEARICWSHCGRTPDTPSFSSFWFQSVSSRGAQSCSPSFLL